MRITVRICSYPQEASMNHPSRISLALSLWLVAAAFGQTARIEPPYALERKVRLGESGGWDYFDVDPASKRIFIPRGSHVMVTSEDGVKIAEIPNLQGAHAVALAPDLNRGFTANDSGHSVTIFALDSLQRIGDVSLGSSTPDGILYDSFTKRIITFNGDFDHDATIIDAANGKIVREVPLGGKPETAQSNEEGRIFVDIQDKDQIAVLDADSGAILQRWSTSPCKEPTGMAIDRRSQRLFVGCRNELLAAVDASSGKIIGHVPIGWLIDANRFDPETQLIFSAAADGTLTIARQGVTVPIEVVQTLPTPFWARTMALDPNNHKLFVVTADTQMGPYPPGTAHPQRQGTSKPGSFTLLIYSLRQPGRL
jgi:hypothetical protein